MSEASASAFVPQEEDYPRRRQHLESSDRGAVR
jgi:hypothetical protein